MDYLTVHIINKFIAEAKDGLMKDSNIWVSGFLPESWIMFACLSLLS